MGEEKKEAWEKKKKKEDWEENKKGDRSHWEELPPGVTWRVNADGKWYKHGKTADGKWMRGTSGHGGKQARQRRQDKIALPQTIEALARFNRWEETDEDTQWLKKDIFGVAAFNDMVHKRHEDWKRDEDGEW